MKWHVAAPPHVDPTETSAVRRTDGRFVLSGPRQAWMDNLRVAVIAGVVITHVATAYVLDVDWYYEERTATVVSEVVLAATIFPGALFALAALFLVAGLLSARSVARRGPRAFARGRLLRLGIPMLGYVLVLGPLAATIGDAAEGEMFSTSVWRSFDENVRTTDSGPMWFVAALLCFSCVYALGRAVRPARRDCADGPLRPRHLVLAAVAIVVASFSVRLAWPFAGDTPFTLNLWEWPQMAVMFSFGALAGERGWLNPPPSWLSPVTARGGALGAVTLVAAGAVAAGSDNSEVFLGGLHLQALVEPVAEATLAVSMSLWVALWFMRHVTFDGRLARALARASYPAYVIHPVVVVLLSAALASIAVMAEVKFLVVATLGIAGAYGVGWIIVSVAAVLPYRLSAARGSPAASTEVNGEQPR